MVKLVKNIILTKTPLTTKYRFGDVFQIYPMNYQGAPSNANAKHFPCVIEFSYNPDNAKAINFFDEKDLDKSAGEMVVRANRLTEIVSLLSSVTNYRFFSYRKIHTAWTMPITKEINVNNLSSTWSIEYYYYPKMKDDLFIHDKFSDIEVPDTTLVPHRKYYYYDPIENPEKTIDLPVTIDEILSNYYSLSEKEKTIADSCIYQIINGLDLFDTTKSLSFFSFVSAIETLVNYEFRNEKLQFKCKACQSLEESARRCPECGAPVWGVAAKYREFLYKYVGEGDEARKLYNKIYGIRSKIAHTEYLFNGEFFLDMDFNDKTRDINMTHLLAMQLARRSLIGWLLKKDIKTHV